MCLVLFLQAFTLESLTRALCSNGNVLDYDSASYVPSLLTLLPYIVLIFQRWFTIPVFIENLRLYILWEMYWALFLWLYLSKASSEWCLDLLLLLLGTQTFHWLLRLSKFLLDCFRTVRNKKYIWIPTWSLEAGNWKGPRTGIQLLKSDCILQEESAWVFC